MADQRIIIDIQNNVKIQASTTATPKQNLSNANLGNKKVPTEHSAGSGGTQKKQFAEGRFDSLFTAQFIAGTFQKFANATGNEEARQISSAVGKMVKYGTAIHSAMSGNPVGLIAAGIEIGAKVVEDYCNEKRKNAEEQNNVDMSRINAGLMDMSGVKVTENFWGRMKYEGK